MITATCKNPACAQLDIVKGIAIALQPDEAVFCGTCMAVCEQGEADIAWPAALAGLEHDD